MQIAFEAPRELVSTEKFLIPYVLEGEIRTYNQEMLKHFKIQRLAADVLCTSTSSVADPLPAVEPVRLRPDQGRRRRRGSTSSTATPWQPPPPGGRRGARRVRCYEFHLVYHHLVQYAAADLSSFYLDVLKDRLYCDAAHGPRRRSAQTVLHRVARDLCLLLAPVLPFTTDEAWRRSAPGSRPSVHPALFPPRETADEAHALAVGGAARRPRERHEGARGGARPRSGSRPASRPRSCCAARPRTLEPLRAHETKAASSPATSRTSSS